MLHIEELTKKYDTTTALSPFTIQIEAGEIVGLYGHNGAGKSTLIKMLACVISPTEGLCTLNGEELGRRTYVKQIGYMPDDFQFHPQARVREFLQLHGSLKGCTKEEVTTALEAVGLLDKQYMKISDLSKGMRQRLLFAQSIVQHPKLLLLDEPTNGLDEQWMEKMKTQLQTYAKEGSIILFSSHDKEFIQHIATRMITMKDGKVNAN